MMTGRFPCRLLLLACAGLVPSHVTSSLGVPGDKSFPTAGRGAETDVTHVGTQVDTASPRAPGATPQPDPVTADPTKVKTLPGSAITADSTGVKTHHGSAVTADATEVKTLPGSAVTTDPTEVNTHHGSAVTADTTEVKTHHGIIRTVPETVAIDDRATDKLEPALGTTDCVTTGGVAEWAVVTTADMDHCQLQPGKRMSVTARREVNVTIDRSPTAQSRTCRLHVELTQPGTVLVLRLLVLEARCDEITLKMTGVDGDEGKTRTLLDLCPTINTAVVMPDYQNRSATAPFFPDAFTVFTLGRRVQLELAFSYSGRRSFVQLRASLTARPTHLSPGVKHVRLSPTTARSMLHVRLSTTTGYLQTPGWDGRSLYPRNMKSFSYVSVPADHVTMASFRRVDLDGVWPRCGQDKVCIKSMPTESYLTCTCGASPGPNVLSALDLLVTFTSDHSDQRTGFRLLYSFHPASQTLQRIWNGRWNCSVPFWPAYRHHFPCNVYNDCLEGEDEAGCPYVCQEGAAPEDCYWYEMLRVSDTWNSASARCRRYGGRLASLNTPREWRWLTDVLALRVNRDLFTSVYLGLRTADHLLPPIYRRMFYWQDWRPAYFVHADHFSLEDNCGKLPGRGSLYQWQDQGDGFTLQLMQCETFDPRVAIMCEFQADASLQWWRAGTHTRDPDPAFATRLYNVIRIRRPPPQTNDTDMDTDVTYPTLPASQHYPFAHVVCPLGHVTHTFLACDPESTCWAREDFGECSAPLSPLPPSFLCDNRLQRVPFSLVCDHRPDCFDRSDEDPCVFEPCHTQFEFDCGNRQCLGKHQRCDGTAQCLNREDERRCPTTHNARFHDSKPPPAIVYFDGRGSYNISNMSSSAPCPDTHFRCPGGGYCLPVFVRCNDVLDCPGAEDEAGCELVTCPGFYRCRQSTVCLHPSHVCDSFAHCPKHDDEACLQSCPSQHCVCQGHAFHCTHRIRPEEYRDLRFLNASGTGMGLDSARANLMLVYLGVARCGLSRIHAVVLPNLRILDLSDNRLAAVSGADLSGMRGLRQLTLAGNPLTSLLRPSNGSLLVLTTVTWLDVSRVQLWADDFSFLRHFPRLRVLNLSQTGLQHVQGAGLHAIVPGLERLDVTGCPVRTFPAQFLRGLAQLTRVWADNYKLCCPVVLPPHFNVRNCRAPLDDISSCEALLRSNAYRVSLFVFAVSALLGNLTSFLYRVLSRRKKSRLAFSVLVTHLSVSDFLMGVYLAIVGVADQLYRGSYLWNDEQWRSSAFCKSAGFLSLVSSEVSAFIICLITLDRLLVFRFPLGTVRLTRTSARAACCLVWGLGLGLAAVPLLPGLARWGFYSHNGICLPLPFAPRSSLGGRDYSFGLMVVLNFVLFLFIAVGQVLISCSIRANSMTGVDRSERHGNDLKVARRLFTVVMSDFLCWFPIGLLGLLASLHVPIPGELNVAVVIFVLPFNSALNPILYTLNTFTERRRLAKKKRMQVYLARQQ